jgi:hypothetical protein
MKKLREEQPRISRKTSYSGKTTMHELRAFIGLLYLAGVLKAGYWNVRELWSEIFGSTVFRATMSITRFEFLTLCIWFDDKASRPEQTINDKSAAIRKIWDMFIANCKMYCTSSFYCTVDEQLLGFRGRCPFRVDIQNKPYKYGIRIMTLSD